jgi:pyrimidine-specific ribonucleoside hydrolase
MAAVTATRVILDMETQDPDDFLTLVFVAGHPRLQLCAVTLLPGTPEQVGLVRWLLQRLNGDAAHAIDVGVGPGSRHDATCVSGWHYRAFGPIPPSADSEPAAAVLIRHSGTGAVLLTGAALTNVGAALRACPTLRYNAWFGQGGFAGGTLVPASVPWPPNLHRWREARFAPTYNFCGNVEAAKRALAHPGFGRILLASKNVCHRNFCDAGFAARISARAAHAAEAASASVFPARAAAALQLLARGTQVYLEKKPQGKKLHDPLIAACLLDESICTWERVSVSYDKASHGWGATKEAHGTTFISTDFDQAQFQRVFLMQDCAPKIDYGMGVTRYSCVSWLRQVAGKALTTVPWG